MVVSLKVDPSTNQITSVLSNQFCSGALQVLLNWALQHKCHYPSIRAEYKNLQQPQNSFSFHSTNMRPFCLREISEIWLNCIKLFNTCLIFSFYRSRLNPKKTYSRAAKFQSFSHIWSKQEIQLDNHWRLLWLWQ